MRGFQKPVVAIGKDSLDEFLSSQRLCAHLMYRTTTKMRILGK